MKKRQTRGLQNLPLPKVIKRDSAGPGLPTMQGFPVEHYSYSSFTKFGSNPFMFKVNNLNGEDIETTTTATNLLGRALHRAMQTYAGGNPDIPIGPTHPDAAKIAHQVGMDFLASYSDGFIGWNSTIESRATLDERHAFCFFTALKEFDFPKDSKDILLVEEMLKHRVEVEGKILPVPLKGSADIVYRHDGEVNIRDYKFTSKYSDPEAIDGAKLLQAAFNYFLTYAELGEAPRAMIFSEFKIVPNKDKSPQVKNYEIVFADHPLIFQFFYRYYEDVTNALLGKQVYVPNVYALFDKEVSILSYIHRLDIDEERDKAFKEMKVDNITDFLKKKIQKDGAMKKYLETVTAKFVSAETLNYKEMNIEEKIKMKMAEHGLGVEFHSKVVGNSVTLYRYEPSVGLKMSKIEAFVKDIEQVVETTGIRILAPIPNSGLVGFEVPNNERTFPKGMPPTDGFNFSIGLDVMGEVVRLDIREAPHLLVAGATGSGKSVFLNSILKQAQDMGPQTLQMVLLDPKMVELQEFSGSANTSVYANDDFAIAEALNNVVKEMEERYKKLLSKKVKNLEEYRAKGGKLPYIIVVLDEYGDLVMKKTNIAQGIRQSILRLSAKARAAGIHIILTTQRPSVKIVDGEIKANFPTRIAFKTASATDSMVILGQDGAEKLLGKGDMLLLTTDKGVQRLQGFYR